MAKITVVGGINIDIEGNPYENLKYKDSNPGKITMSFGGVGRNIVENVARMGGDVAMISAIGDDSMGQAAKSQLESLGTDVSCVKTVEGQSTSMYLSILNSDNDMELALSDMEIIEHITPEFLDEHMKFLKDSSVVALDGNLESDILEYITGKLEGVPMFFDPVSSVKALRAKDIIGRFHSIKPNLIEAQVLSGMEINGEQDIKRAAQWFIEQGVKQVFITLSEGGVFYKDSEKEGFVRPLKTEILSATGAGDSFSAMILMGIWKNADIKMTAQMGICAASVTMESKTAVNEKMCIEEIKRRMENV